MTWKIYYDRVASLAEVREDNRRADLIDKPVKTPEELQELRDLGLDRMSPGDMGQRGEPVLVLEIPDAEFQDKDGNCIWLPPDDPPWTAPGKRGGTYSYEQVP